MSTQQIEWTARDIECAQAVLGGTGDGSLPTLTDEEIVALDGVERSQLVPLPFLDKNDGDRRLMATIALRGLLAKAVAFPVTREGDTEPTSLGASTDITGILTLRRTGQRIVSGERRSAAGTQWLFGYVHGGQVLEEQISDAGVHAFEVYPVAQLSERLTALVDPEAAAGAQDGEREEITQQVFEAQAPRIFADAIAVTTVAAGGIEPNSDTSFTVYASGNRVRTLDAAAAPAGTAFTVAEISSDTLRRRISEDLIRA